MVSDLDTLSARYLDAQLAADRAEAVRVILEDGLAAGASVSDLLIRVILPAQREIGRLWQENRITIADEHVATAISQLVVAQLYGRVEARSAVGCGDASVAGFAVARRRGLAGREFVRFAAACGTANCLADAPGRIDRREVERLLLQSSVAAINGVE